MEYVSYMIANYVFLMLERQRREEDMRWLRRQSYAAHLPVQPGILARAFNRLLALVGSLLVSIGQRLQQPRQNMTTTASVTK